MERGRRLAVAAVGIAVMLLTAGLVLRMAGSGEDTLDLSATPTSLDALSGTGDEVLAGAGIQPGDPPEAFDPSIPPGLGTVPATLPTPGVATIPLPDLSTGATTGTQAPSTTSAAAGPAFAEKGVWVVKTDGTSPILVARNATAGVGAAGTWVAYLEGSTVRAVRRSDLRTAVEVATGVGGTAASGLPISGGRRGVAFLREGRAVLVDPASPGRPVATYEAPGADAVAAEEDGEGRLVWADAGGLHLGTPESVAPSEDVERGMLVLGHGVLASVQGGQVVVRDGPTLAWGAVDRLQTGTAGLVAGSGGRVRFRSSTGEERVVLDRATTPVVTGNRILYVAEKTSLASASLTGTGAAAMATAGPGRTITGLDLLDDTTVVVTVA